MFDKCAWCGRSYIRASNRQKYCTVTCRSAANPYIPTGEGIGRRRLFTDATVKRIRRRVQVEGVPIKDIAEALGCTPWTIRAIAHGYGTYKENTG